MADLDCDDEAIILDPQRTDLQPARNTLSAQPELSHIDVRDRLSDYFDGSLPDAEAHQVKRHLIACVDCRHFSETLYQTIQGLRSLGPRPASTEAKRRLRDLTAQPETPRIR